MKTPLSRSGTAEIPLENEDCPAGCRPESPKVRENLNNLCGGAPMKPTISVVMPVYNAKRYVAEAIESILGQTFRDFEFLIIDDGSTDGSLAILKHYAARDARIRLWSGPNAGYVPRLNEMLALARGELIARMDADDVSFPDRFVRQVEFLRDHPDVDVVGGSQECIDSRGFLMTVCRPPQGHDEIQECALTGAGPISHPTVMMRRRAVLAVGGYREELMPAEDFDLWLRMGERGLLANLPDVIIRYRMHDLSVSASLQHCQLGHMQAAVDSACDRRGIARRDLKIPPWRPVNRASAHQWILGYGWQAFHRGDRGSAIHFGVGAVRLMPHRRTGWTLLACALLKMDRKSTPQLSREGG
jgi:glycosyltransferase involved in cell wall biosynthesis